MVKKPIKHVKHVPQRTCVGCRQVMPKRALVRVVRDPDGVRIDPIGKAAGRGAYVHQNRSCWERAMKGALASALKTELTSQDRAVLLEYMQNLPVEDMNTAE